MVVFLHVLRRLGGDRWKTQQALPSRWGLRAHCNSSIRPPERSPKTCRSLSMREGNAESRLTSFCLGFNTVLTNQNKVFYYQNRGQIGFRALYEPQILALIMSWSSKFMDRKLWWQKSDSNDRLPASAFYQESSSQNAKTTVILITFTTACILQRNSKQLTI